MKHCNDISWNHQMQTIGILAQYTRNMIKSIESELRLKLPGDYIEFLQCYGDGDIDERLYFHKPDASFIQQNFKNDLDLWALTDVQTESICNSVTVGKSVDGDVFCYNGKSNLWIILPRHSDRVIEKNLFGDLITHYKEKGVIKANNPWFDPAYQRILKSFSLVYDGKIDNTLIERIENDFVSSYTFDAILNKETQPKYILQAIGGWIYFDNVYKSSIRLKFQNQFESEASVYANFLQKYLSDLWE